MTTAAVTTKLAYLLGRGASNQIVADLLGVNLRGEITTKPDDNSRNFLDLALSACKRSKSLICQKWAMVVETCCPFLKSISTYHCFIFIIISIVVTNAN